MKNGQAPKTDLPPLRRLTANRLYALHRVLAGGILLVPMIVLGMMGADGVDGYMTVAKGFVVVAVRQAVASVRLQRMNPTRYRRKVSIAPAVLTGVAAAGTVLFAMLLAIAGPLGSDIDPLWAP